MSDQFSKALTPRGGIDYQIELVLRAKLPVVVPYKMETLELPKLSKQLNELLEKCFIRPLNAPFRVSVLFQKKRNERLRLCIDYRALNKLIMCNTYSILLIAYLFDQLSNAPSLI